MSRAIFIADGEAAMNRKSGTVEAVSKNKAALAVSNDEGWTVVERIGSEGEIAAGDIVFGDWQALGGETRFAGTQEKSGNWRQNRDSASRQVRRSCQFAAACQRSKMRRHESNIPGGRRGEKSRRYPELCCRWRRGGNFLHRALSDGRYRLLGSLSGWKQPACIA